MPKYSVTIQYERTQTIEVEADSKDEAIRIVNEGEFENDQINGTEDDYVEILGAILIKNWTYVQNQNYNILCFLC